MDVGVVGSGEAEGDSRSTIAELTAEFIFPVREKNALSDYHKNMDADTFISWVEKRLVPVFKAKGQSRDFDSGECPYHLAASKHAGQPQTLSRNERGR